MKRPFMKNDAQLFNSLANTAREYRRAWSKHGNPDRCVGLMPKDITLEDIKGVLDELRTENDAGGSSLFFVFLEELFEMLEAAETGNYRAFKVELSQCHAVLERIDDYIKAKGARRG